MLKEQEDAAEKKRLADLKEKELEEAMEKKRKEKGTDGDSEGELSEVPKVLKAQACQYLKEKCKGKRRATEPGMSPSEERKRKWMMKSASVVESREEGVASFSKRVKLEVMGPTEGEDKFLGNSEYFLRRLIRC